MSRGLGDVYKRQSERRRHKTHGHLHVQILPVTFKDVMGLDANADVKIACGAAVLSGRSAVGNTHTVAVIHTGGNRNLELFLLFMHTGAVALVAGMRNVLAGSVAARTGLLNLEEAGAGADITAAVTGRAGFYLRALFCTGSAAGCALAPGGNLNLCLVAFCGLFKRCLLYTSPSPRDTR